MNFAASSARLRSSADAIAGFGLPAGTTTPAPTLQIATVLAGSILPAFTSAGIDRVEPMTRSASSPPMTHWLMAPIVP